MCEGYTYCASPDEIREWLASKYIVLLYNELIFRPESFFEASTIKESRIYYIPVSSQTRQLIQYQVT